MANIDPNVMEAIQLYELERLRHNAFMRFQYQLEGAVASGGDALLAMLESNVDDPSKGQGGHLMAFMFFGKYHPTMEGPLRRSMQEVRAVLAHPRAPVRNGSLGGDLRFWLHVFESRERGLADLEAFLRTSGFDATRARFGTSAREEEDALAVAGDTRQAELIRFLLDVAGFQVEDRDAAGRTPFLVALEKGRLEVARACVERGCQTFMADAVAQSEVAAALARADDVHRALTLAFLQDELGFDVVGLLSASIPNERCLLILQGGTPSDPSVLHDRRWLHDAAAQACVNGQVEAALRILALLGEGPNALFPMGRNRLYAFLSPLGIALRHARHDVARALLSAGADPTHGAVTLSSPPGAVDSLLHAFCLCEPSSGALERLLALPEAKARLDLESRMPIGPTELTGGATALQIAYWRRDFASASALLQAGADPRSVAFDRPVTERFKPYASRARADHIQRLIKEPRREPKRLRLLHMARACNDTAAAVAHVVEAARKAGEIAPDADAAAAAVQLRERCAAKAPKFVRSRLLRGEAPPRAEMAEAAILEAQGVKDAERLRAVAECVVSDAFLPEHFVELKEMLAPAWYDPLEG